jgi:glycosyltransferase involved in cell wall biosynthesis
VAIVPNGIDLPDLATVPRQRGSDRIVLSLGRIHPKKGLDRLVRAWAKIEAEFPSWRLRLVGPAEAGHDKRLAALARSLRLQRVTIEGPIYDAERKLSAYRSADLFVLPTLNENFALTVAEALAAEVPAISTKGAPWAGLETERCGWWIDHGAEPLAAALRHAMTIGCEARQAMGARGRAWMARDFGWDRVAGDMLAVYRWLKSGGEPPRTVRVD